MHQVLKRWLDTNLNPESYQILAYYNSNHDLYKIENGAGSLVFHWNSHDIGTYETYALLKVVWNPILLQNLPTKLFEAFELEGWNLNYPISVDYD